MRRTPRRRWLEERFAEVVAARVVLGDVVVLVGDDSDAPAAAAIERLAASMAGAVPGPMPGTVPGPMPGAGSSGSAAGSSTTPGDESGSGAGRVVDLSGQLSIGELAAVLAVSDVVVADDSGPRHLAVAVGARTVGVFWFGNIVTAAPLHRGRHRIEISFVTRCPVCGRDVTQVGWTATRCEHDPSFVAEVTAESVLADVEDLLATR